MKWQGTDAATVFQRRPWNLLVLAAIAGCFVAALAAWGFSSPAGSSPDDEFHLAKIYCQGGEADCTSEGQRLYPCYAWQPGVTGDCQPTAAVAEVTGLPKLREPYGPLTTPHTEYIKWDGRPTAYYWVTGLLVGDTVAETSAFVRLFNVLLAVGMAVASVLLARRNLRWAAGLSWLVASVPLGVFIVASVNPNSWMVIGIAAMWAPLLSVTVEKRFQRLTVYRLVFVQLALILALGSRNEASVIAATAAVAIALFRIQRPDQLTRADWWRVAIPLVVVVESALVLAAVALTKVTAIAEDPQWESVGDFGAFDAILGGWTSLMGGVVYPTLGWLDTGMPLIVVSLTTAVFLGSLLVGLSVAYRRKTAAVVFFAVASLAFAAFFSWRSGGSLGNSQPRYFLPALFVLAGLALLPRIPGRPTAPNRVQAGVLLAALAVANSLALLRNLERYVTGEQTPPLTPGDLAAVPAPQWWWESMPIGPYGLWLTGSLAFAAGSALLWWRLPGWSGCRDGQAGGRRRDREAVVRLDRRDTQQAQDTGRRDETATPSPESSGAAAVRLATTPQAATPQSGRS